MRSSLSAPPRPTCAIVAIAIAGLAFGLLFPDRTDYVGHFLAGAGGTLLLLALVVSVRPHQPLVVVLATCGSILLGVLAEATVFRLAEFDPLDLANQSLGALLAGIGLLDGQRDAATTGPAILGGFFFLVTGFALAFA